MDRRHFLSLAACSLSSHLIPARADNRAATGIVMDQQFLLHQLSANHPESPARYQAIQHAVEKNLWHRPLVKLKPLAGDKTFPWLSLVHSEAHIEAIASHTTHFDSALLATSASLAAVDAVMLGQVRNAFCASRPPGHHALNTGQEEGFCFFNHIAVAAKYAQQQYKIGKILIIDWDYHHGNGTEWAYYDDPSVLFFSTHDQYAYPGTGSPLKKGDKAGLGFNINVHLDCGSDDETIMAAFKQHLAPAIETFEPELILISAGFDSRQDDLLGCFNITDQGFYQLTRWVMTMADKYCQSRLVSILEGGYNTTGNASAVISHLEALNALP